MPKKPRFNGRESIKGIGQTLVTPTMLIRWLFDDIEQLLVEAPAWRSSEKAMLAYAEWQVYGSGPMPSGLDEAKTAAVDQLFDERRPETWPSYRTTECDSQSGTPDYTVFAQELRQRVGKLATFGEWGNDERQQAERYITALTSQDSQFPKGTSWKVTSVVDKTYQQLREEPPFSAMPASYLFARSCYLRKLKQLLQHTRMWRSYQSAQKRLLSNYAKSLVTGEKLVEPDDLEPEIISLVHRKFAQCYLALRGILGDTLDDIPGVKCHWFAEECEHATRGQSER